ncbi:MAG: carboxypeptidase regulatory-like domain-containing protein [Gemmatimonadota bacterium]|nr:carboxypeptidase regulatory-like domain-containing protein [Gemmatimonadota bacterium]
MRVFWSSGVIGFSICVFLVGVNASEAGGQVVRGRLLDGDGSTAIGGAMMSLVGDSEQEQERDLNLTRESGLYQLIAAVPGRYRVRAERIGYATTYSDYFEIAAGDTILVDLVARVEAVSLMGIEAEGERRCRVRPEEGLAVARVWDEARKALKAAAWTQERGYYRYEMMGIERQMDRENRRVISEERTHGGGYGQAPYVSLPAAQLMKDGFARLTPSESVYWAPDAAVLLSDEFLNTHCFRVGRDENRAPGLIGLAFQPVGGRDVAEISGTLWIDHATSELRRLDFYYENLELPEALLSAPTGGTVEFRALPNGTWIVDSWRIRVPRARMTTNPLTRRAEPVLDGISVHGGDVLRVHGNEGTVLEADPGGRIAGVVFDSLQVGLAGARVYIEGLANEAVTSGDGRFELIHLEPGVYSVTFSHPYLEPYGYIPDPFEVEVVEGAKTPAQVNFVAPTMTRIANGLCSGAERPAAKATTAHGASFANDGVLIGQVTDGAGEAIAGAMVRVLLQSFDINGLSQPSSASNVIGVVYDGAVFSTDRNGHYLACWVPVDIDVRVSVVSVGSEVELNALRGEVLWNLAELQGETVVILSEVPVRTLDLRVESN